MADDQDLPTAGEHAVFVSARLFTDDEARVGVATYEPDDVGHELRDGRVLSGWSLMVGDEVQDELSDPEHIRLPSLRVVLERFPEVGDLLEVHDGTETSWLRRDDGWHRAEA